jgi:hypothetical protein
MFFVSGLTSQSLTQYNCIKKVYSKKEGKGGNKIGKENNEQNREKSKLSMVTAMSDRACSKTQFL